MQKAIEGKCGWKLPTTKMKKLTVLAGNTTQRKKNVTTENTYVIRLENESVVNLSF